MTITILSIDGGGIRGMIPATFLEQLEARTGQPVFELFDYVAGTSTGGILALGLTRGAPGSGAGPLRAAELMALYENEGRHIFQRSLWHAVEAVGNLNGPKYPEDGVDRVLRRAFGAARLKDARTNVLVTGYEIERRCPFFFRSWQAASTPLSHDFSAWEVARCTSAAPTYFPPRQIHSADGFTYSLIDGGVFANNPALCAWVEAHDRHPGHDILVVSLGTGNLDRRIPWAKAKGWGLAGWAPSLLEIVFDGVSQTVDVELDEILNQRGADPSHFRFQVALEDRQQELDDTDPDNLSALKEAGQKMAQDPAFDQVCRRLLAVQADRSAQGQPYPLPSAAAVAPAPSAAILAPASPVPAAAPAALRRASAPPGRTGPA